MWSLSEIFVSNSDKANLITAVISVVAAVIVVYLTHALAYRRSRIELRAKKMEELYAAVSIFGDLGYRLIHERANPDDKDEKSHEPYYEAHKKIVMLASIYLNGILKEINEMHLITILIKDDGSEPTLGFPAKLTKYVELKKNIQNTISNKARKIV